MENLIQKIKELKNIHPDADFWSKSRQIVLSSPQAQRVSTHLWESFRYSLSLGLGTLILVVALGGFSYFKWGGSSPFIVGSLNAKSLSLEAENADAGLSLAEAKYFESSSQAVSIALKQMVNDEPDHLNSGVLERELKQLDMPTDDDKNVDELLNQILL